MIKIKIILSVSIIILFLNKGFMQTIDHGKDWKLSLQNDKYFTTENLDKFIHLDLSPAISNNDAFSHYLLRTYTGILGQHFRRIDFFIKVSKIINDNINYSVIGKYKFNSIVKPLKGNLKLLEIRKQIIWPDLNEPYLAIFEYTFYETDTISSGSIFKGFASILFRIENNIISCFLTDGPDFINYRNVFVGIWKENNSENIQNCIFSFRVVELYFKLPFCDNLYFLPNSEYQHQYEINKKYLQYGWSDYSYSQYNEDAWWK
jgi:hypothetical protein